MNLDKGHKIPLARRKEIGIQWEKIEHGDSVVVEDKSEANYVVKTFNRVRDTFPALELSRFTTRQQTIRDPVTKEPSIRIFFINQDKDTDEQVEAIRKRFRKI